MPSLPLPSVGDIAASLRGLYPLHLAEPWDNVGLLVGDETAGVARILTCLTITPESAEEAIQEQVNLIVTHHPLPFHATKRLTTDTTATRLLWQLARAGIAVYSPHTAFDSAARGINCLALERIGCDKIRPLIPNSQTIEALGAGRYGDLPAAISLAELAARLKTVYELDTIQLVGDLDRMVTRCGSACGSGGSFVAAAADLQCDLLVTGEASFHDCLEARSRNLALLLLGHYASERFGIEHLASELAEQFPSVQVWPSRQESDPVQFV